MEKTITINGRSITLRPDMRAADLHALAGLGADRVLIARRPDGVLQLLGGHQPLPSPEVISAPRFIYG